MNNKRIVKNIGVSMIMKPISMILSFVYTPLVLKFLGQEKYGVWAIILNIVTWINYFDIGIGNGLRNRLTESITKDDKEVAKKYVSTAYLGTTVISIIFCLLITSLWNILDLTDFFNVSLNDENTNIVICISVLFVCINFVLSLSKTSAYAIQQPSIISISGVIGQILQIITLVVLSVFYKENLLAVSLMYGIVSLFDSLFVYFVVTRKREYLKPRIKLVDYTYMKPLLSLGVGFFALQICSLVLNTTDNLLISSMYGSKEVTPYSIVYKFFYIAVQVHAIIIMPMWSAYTEAATRKDISWIKNTMKKINYITLLFSVFVIGGIFIFEPFAKIWLQKELTYGKLLIVLVAVYMIVQMFANNYSSFLCGVGDIHVSTIISAIGAILNIPLSIFFARVCNMGLAGVIFGSLIVMGMSIFILPIVAKKWIKCKDNEWNLL